MAGRNIFLFCLARQCDLDFIDFVRYTTVNLYLKDLIIVGHDRDDAHRCFTLKH